MTASISQTGIFLHLKTNNRQEENAVTVSFCLCLSLLLACLVCVVRSQTRFQSRISSFIKAFPDDAADGRRL